VRAAELLSKVNSPVVQTWENLNARFFNVIVIGRLLRAHARPVIFRSGIVGES
jgi:hypothetical protein